MKKIAIVAMVVLVGLLSSCATVFHGTKQEVKFDSSPSGAKVYLDGTLVGTTPLTLKLKKNKYSNLRVELEGYQTVERKVEKEYDLVALLNIFWDYSTTDLLDGAAFKYTDNSYFIELKKNN